MENPIHAWAGTLGALGFVAFGALAYYVTSEDASVIALIEKEIAIVKDHDHKKHETRLGVIEMNQTNIMTSRATMRQEVEQLMHDKDLTQLGISELATKLERVDRELYRLTTTTVGRDVMQEVVKGLNDELNEIRMQIQDLENKYEQSERRQISNPPRSGSTGVSGAGNPSGG
jgi:predicted RNase H-like nuclease (RuvC/YqgF family)